MLLNDIDFDEAERKICRDCVEEIQGWGKSDTLKKVVDSTFYGTDESEEYKEEAGGAVLGGDGDEASVMPVVYPSVPSLGSFLSVGLSSKPSHPSLTISIGVHLVQDYFKKKRGGEEKIHQATGGEGQA